MAVDDRIRRVGHGQCQVGRGNDVYSEFKLVVESDNTPAGPGRAQIKKRIQEFEMPLKNERGLSTAKVEYKARARLGQYLRPPKNPAYLDLAIQWMERIAQEDLPRLRARDYHDLVKAYEIQSILTVGEMMARASLYRDESRWGYQHWRVDLPARKKEFRPGPAAISSARPG